MKAIDVLFVTELKLYAMISDHQSQSEFLARFAFLQSSSAQFQQEFFQHVTTVTVPDGHTIATEGDTCSQLALVYSGVVRVYKLAESGREITLYRIKQGNSCILTASCIIGKTPFPAIAQAESEVKAAIIPAAKAASWITTYPAWSRFVFGLISQRLVDVIALLEDAVFHHMDARIASYLLGLGNQGVELSITHQQIASH